MEYILAGSIVVNIVLILALHHAYSLIGETADELREAKRQLREEMEMRRFR